MNSGDAMIHQYGCRYNYTGIAYFFEIKKRWPLRLLLDTARRMTVFALPIKCLEAVVLGIYLTQGLQAVSRFTLIFHSRVDRHTYKHIVLGPFFILIFYLIGIYG